MEKDFFTYLFNKVYNSVFRYELYEDDIGKAINLLYQDVHFNYPNMGKHDIIKSIEKNSNWLPVLLYRIGNTVYKRNSQDALLIDLHGLMRELCSMEIYFSINIGTGFEIRHGIGSVIGSRCAVGNGFVLHHGCTIGHRHKFGNGPTIGNYVEMGANSSILGEISIGDSVIVGAHSIILKSVNDNTKIYGIY